MKNDSEVLIENLTSLGTSNEFYPWIINIPVTLFMLTCIGCNVIVFSLAVFSRTYHNPTNYLLANLCLASTLFILNAQFILLERQYELWSFDPTTCMLSAALHRLPLPLTTMSILALCVDRCRVARNPLSMASGRRVSIQIVCIWAVSISLASPRALGSHFNPDLPGVYKCEKVRVLRSQFAQEIYAVCYFGIIHALPAFVLLKELGESKKQMRYLGACQAIQGKSFCRRLRLLRNACIFTWIFMLFWLPLGVVHLYLDWIVPAKGPAWVLLAKNISRHFALLQACINPSLVYLLSFDCQDYFSGCLAKLTNSWTFVSETNPSQSQL